MTAPPSARFRPPPLELEPELGWLLRAAFAGAPAPPAEGLDPALTVRRALEFDLAPRIVARHGYAAVASRLGPGADELKRSHRRAVAVSLAAGRLARTLGRAAAATDLPLLFLKGYALDRLLATPGLRPYLDLDVLAPSARVDEAGALFLQQGLAAVAVPANEQHLAPLVAPDGTPVDLHFRLRGVDLGGGWATAEELDAAGLCQPDAELGGSAATPVPRLLAAHLLAHGLEQHAFRPGGYPLLRLVADLIDLAPDPDRWEEFLGPAADWIAGAVPHREVAAAFRLAARLSRGELPDRRRDAAAELLLRHVVAGTLDAEYRESLRWAHTSGRLRTAARQGHLLGYIARKLRALRHRS